MLNLPMETASAETTLLNPRHTHSLNRHKTTNDSKTVRHFLTMQHEKRASTHTYTQTCMLRQVWTTVQHKNQTWLALRQAPKEVVGVEIHTQTDTRPRGKCARNAHNAPNGYGM